MNTANIVKTVAGTGADTYNGENVAATSANIALPTGIAVDPSNGDIYVACTNAVRIQVLTKSTELVSTFAGSGNAGWTGDEGYATAAGMEFPEGLFLDTSNNLYFADMNSNVVRFVTSNSPSVAPTTAPSLFPSNKPTVPPSPSPIAPSTSPTVAPSYSCAPTASPTLTSHPTAAPTSARSSTQYLFTIAGTGNTGSTGSEGLATSAWINDPRGVWQNTNGVLYFSEYNGHCVRKFSVSDYIVNDFAGVCGINAYGSPGGPATSTDLYNPLGVMGDTNGNVYVGDSVNNRVAKVSSSGILTNIVGSGSFTNSGDGGSATSAQTKTPTWLWISTSGQTYFVCYDSYIIRTINPSGIISTFAGTY